MTSDDLSDVIRHWGSCREMALDAEKPFRSLASLKYLEQALLTYWNEAPPARHVEEFWSRVAAEGLGYERKDILGTILARGRLIDRNEYEFALDTLVIAQQEGRLTEAQAADLSAMIGRFEKRRQG